MLNDLGMLFVCGFFKRVNWKTITGFFTTNISSGNSASAGKSSVFPGESSEYAVGSLANESVVDFHVNDQTGSIRRMRFSARVANGIGNQANKYAEPEHEIVWKALQQHSGLLHEPFEGMDLAFVPAEQAGLRAVVMASCLNLQPSHQTICKPSSHCVADWLFFDRATDTRINGGKSSGRNAGSGHLTTECVPSPTVVSSLLPLLPPSLKFG